MIYIFVDTNFFLQYQSIDQIKWRTLFNKDITIFILRKVLTEIDNHKNSPNRRLSRRAKTITPLLRHLRERKFKTISSNEIEITIRLAEKFNTKEPKRDFFDLSKADDCIVNEVLHWAEKNKNKEYYVLTGDMGLLNTCDDCEVPSKELPDEWRLPPEIDERDKQIKLLKDQLEKLPKIEIKPEKNIYDVNIYEYLPLSSEEIKNIYNKLCDTFPEKHDFSDQMKKTEDAHLAFIEAISPNKIKIIYPTDTEINTYHKKYEEWKKDIFSKLDKIHEDIFNEVEKIKISFDLYNIGTTPAESLNIKIEATGNLLLLPPAPEPHEKSWGYEELKLPFPPEPPEQHLFSYGMTTSRPFDTVFSLPPLAPPPKERNQFYWEGNGKPKTICSYWEFSCIEFQHKGSPEPFDLDILIPEKGLEGKTEIKLTIYARNLPNIIEKTIPIRPKKIKINEILHKRILSYIDIFIKKTAHK